MLPSGSQTVFSEDHGICDHFPGDPWIISVIATVKLNY